MIVGHQSKIILMHKKYNEQEADWVHLCFASMFARPDKGFSLHSEGFYD